MLEEFQAGAYNVGIAGVRKSEADLTHRAAAARNTYGSDGAGVKIGVLSDGVDAPRRRRRLRRSRRRDGAARPDRHVGDEGTAMLEIIHDIAPGAQLYFATAFTQHRVLRQNIRDLRAAGCDIIVDDVVYYVESPFQDGQAPASSRRPTAGWSPRR